MVLDKLRRDKVGQAYTAVRAAMLLRGLEPIDAFLQHDPDGSDTVQLRIIRGCMHSALIA